MGCIGIVEQGRGKERGAINREENGGQQRPNSQRLRRGLRAGWVSCQVGHQIVLTDRIPAVRGTVSHDDDGENSLCPIRTCKELPGSVVWFLGNIQFRSRRLLRPMPTLAAIDIGSNSCRLKIARVEAHRLKTLHEDREVTRLGASVFESGLVSPESMAAT